MVPKLIVRVRFSSPAPTQKRRSDAVSDVSCYVTDGFCRRAINACHYLRITDSFVDEALAEVDERQERGRG